MMCDDDCAGAETVGRGGSGRRGGGRSEWDLAPVAADEVGGADMGEDCGGAFVAELGVDGEANGKEFSSNLTCLDIMILFV
jgi:hypothetical protein